MKFDTIENVVCFEFVDKQQAEWAAVCLHLLLEIYPYVSVADIYRLRKQRHQIPNPELLGWDDLDGMFAYEEDGVGYLVIPDMRSLL